MVWGRFEKAQIAAQGLGYGLVMHHLGKSDEQDFPKVLTENFAVGIKSV